MTPAVMVAVSVMLAGIVCTAAACVLIWRDRKPDNSPRASDGSRFWGRRNAEATAGKVVTRESGSREAAAKALAEADRAVTIPPQQAMSEAGPDHWRVYALRLHDMLDETRAEARGLRYLAEERMVALNEAHDEAAQLRGALAECRRELAEARAAQAVPVPSYGYTIGIVMRDGCWRLEPPIADGTSS